ncbi:hypothetical protein ILUMI_17762 [Ignelater luminosus]|uniref:Uncharacterized protein n=1 Tax=Ignelater luminosus TaxID=2038154 RepID=A0A8K0CMP3_IGNLU|nr:hypothetical protein ILUMI_17762 [Ignelater luminosus]
MPTDFTVKELHSKLTENIKQVSFTVAERCKFFKMCQNNEILTEFALKLKQQADNCEFPNIFYEALITAFVMNIDSTDIRTHLFQKTFKTFNECVKCAKALCAVLEAASKKNSDQDILKQGTNFEVYSISNKYKKKVHNTAKQQIQNKTNFNTGPKENTKTFKCRNCALIHGINQCPAYRVECRSCSSRSKNYNSVKTNYIEDIFQINSHKEPRSPIKIQVFLNSQNNPTKLEFNRHGTVNS